MDTSSNKLVTVVQMAIACETHVGVIAALEVKDALRRHIQKHVYVNFSEFNDLVINFSAMDYFTYGFSELFFCKLKVCSTFSVL